MRARVFAAGDVGFGERAYPIEDPSGNMMVLGELRGVGVEERRESLLGRTGTGGCVGSDWGKRQVTERKVVVTL